jgi:TusA-related sulfurtransferase
MLTYRIITIIAVIAFVLSLSPASFSQEGKPVVLNTRGACLTVGDFKALIKNELKRAKSGLTLKLIIDTPNEKEAMDALKQMGLTASETTRDKDKDSTTYTIKVSK